MMWRFGVVVFIALMVAQYANAECNVCNTNGVACTSNTTFQLCFKGAPGNTTYSCPRVGDVCTSLGLICADPTSNAQVQASCGNTEQCGSCAGVNDGAYTCTSRNTFGMCMSSELTTVQGKCPNNEICLTSRANGGLNPCVNECLRDAVDMCDIASSSATTTTTTTTTATATTASTVTITTEDTTQTPSTASPSTASTGTTVSSEDAVCTSTGQVGRYPYRNDTTCTIYVYCYLDGATNNLVGRPMSCPPGRYFNRSINNCQVALPVGCVVGSG